MLFGRRAILKLCFWLAFAEFASAVQLPVRTYATGDGLPRNTTNCIVSDSRGFLWFCTPEGLARFDGYQFKTYGVDQGLPDSVVNTFLETRTGRLLVGTTKGLAVFKQRAHDSERSRFNICPWRIAKLA